MVSELLIAALVLVLGAYWFRYNCLSILKSRTSPEYVHNVASANDLSFPEVEARLRSELTTAELDVLKKALLRDYKVLTCLLRYTAATAYTVEQRILILDFKVMLFRYALTHRHLRRLAGRSLGECVRVLNHFAGTMGQRTATMRHA